MLRSGEASRWTGRRWKHSITRSASRWTGRRWKNSITRPAGRTGRAYWLSEAPLGEWFGVVTDSNGRVTSLTLTGNGLSGAIPPELGDLSNLRVLNLGVNELSGGIPPELANLTNLQWLDLELNELSGGIPPELAALTNLRELDLGSNELSGGIPPELADLTNLQWLNLGGNELSGGIPPELADLTNLQGLYLGGNELSGRIPPELGRLTNLEGLSLWGNELSGSIPPELGDLTNLEGLSLWGNELSGGIPPELADLTNLQWLELGGNRLNGKIPWELMQLSELRKFDISRTDICVPTDDYFQAWLATISDFRSSRLACDGSLRVAFSPSSYVVREGGSVEVTVRLIDQTEGPARSATIALTVTPGGGAAGHDYAGVPERVTITAPASTGTFLVTAVEDHHYDHAETITFGFRRPLPSGVTVGSPDTATVTIIDPGTVAMTDREVLEALYEVTGGPEWRDRTNWLSEAPLGEWFGVVTDRNGWVTSLALPGNGLRGAIPPALGRLASLQRMDLGDRWDPEARQWVDNELSGEIPPELADLTNLQELDLGGNELSGEIPPELGRLASLERLDLGARWDPSARRYFRGNELSGAIPRELGDLTNLQVLNLGHNKLNGAIPPELGDLTNLQWLDLRRNELSGAIPPELGDLTNLIELRIGFNPNLTGPIPRQLLQLRLSILDLMATAVCVPLDEEFQDWLATISLFTPSGAICGRLPEAMTSIDVAVFYTPAARRRAGGTAEIEAEIDLLVAETNQAYEDSGVNQRIVLAAREEVPYEEENGSGYLAIDRLASERDGYMDEVHAIRDRVGADLVHLITEVTDVGGVAHLTGAFGLTCAACDAGVFAHELGHNMGLSHDRYVDHGLLPYSYGYVNQRAFADGAPESARWRTIMTYVNQCDDTGLGCVKILRFSNPNQSYLGDPLGVSGESRTSAVTGPADAARALNITRHSVAAFRARSQDTISRAPSGGKQAARSPPVPGVRSGGLFTAISPPKHGVAESDPKALRRREVAVDIGQLAQVPADRPTALPLNLFDDVMLTGVIVKRTPTSSGGYALTGPLFGVAGGTVALVVNRDVVAGTVRLPGATYRIRPAGAGRHAIVQVDPSQSSWRCGTEPWPR